MPKNNVKNTTQLDPDFARHLRILGLKSAREYREWCQDQGFGRGLNKSHRLRSREISHYQQTIAQQKIAKRRRDTRRPLDKLMSICRGEVAVADIKQQHFVGFAEAIVSKSNGCDSDPPTCRTTLASILQQFYRQRLKFVVAASGTNYLSALPLIVSRKRSWLRPIDSWQPNTRSPQRQFQSLLRHLFDRYGDVPEFLDKVWTLGKGGDAALHRDWYLHLGRGGNLRHCDLPIDYTKRMAHYFLRAPAKSTVKGALRFGQILGLGGDRLLAKAIVESPLGESFDNEDFWITAIRWFIQHPMLDRAQIGPIIDYIRYVRFAGRDVVVAENATNDYHPNFTLKGRTPATLLRQVERWHNRLNSTNAIQVQQWSPCGVKPFVFEEGQVNTPTFKRWSIRELLSTDALMVEGRQLRHCVVSYAWSCARGACSIWTMELKDENGLSKLLTIELRNGAICQVRGRCNRLARPQEMAVIRRWAAKEGLQIRPLVC